MTEVQAPQFGSIDKELSVPQPATWKPRLAALAATSMPPMTATGAFPGRRQTTNLPVQRTAAGIAATKLRSMASLQTHTCAALIAGAPTPKKRGLTLALFG